MLLQWGPWFTALSDLLLPLNPTAVTWKALFLGGNTKTYWMSVYIIDDDGLFERDREAKKFLGQEYCCCCPLIKQNELLNIQVEPSSKLQQFFLFRINDIYRNLFLIMIPIVGFVLTAKTQKTIPP